MTKTIRKTIIDNQRQKNKTLRNRAKFHGGNCDEFDKKDARNKRYTLPNDYPYPANFVLYSGKSNIQLSLGESIEFNYIIEAHALKHVDSFDKDCNAKLDILPVHQFYNPYSAKRVYNKEEAVKYTNLLNIHMSVLVPYVEQALSEKYIQKVLFQGFHGMKLHGYTTRNVFLPSTPITIYCKDKITNRIYAISGSWMELNTKDALNHFNSGLYNILGLTIPKLLIDIKNNAISPRVFNIFQIVKTRLPDIPPVWLRCLNNTDYPDSTSICF